MKGGLRVAFFFGDTVVKRPDASPMRVVMRKRTRQASEKNIGFSSGRIRQGLFTKLTLNCGAA